MPQEILNNPADTQEQPIDWKNSVEVDSNNGAVIADNPIDWKNSVEPAPKEEGLSEEPFAGLDNATSSVIRWFNKSSIIGQLRDTVAQKNITEQITKDKGREATADEVVAAMADREKTIKSGSLSGEDMAGLPMAFGMIPFGLAHPVTAIGGVAGSTLINHFVSIKRWQEQHDPEAPLYAQHAADLGDFLLAAIPFGIAGSIEGGIKGFYRKASEELKLPQMTNIPADRVKNIFGDTLLLEHKPPVTENLPELSNYGAEDLPSINSNILSLSRMLEPLRKRGMVNEAAEVERNLKSLLDIQKEILNKERLGTEQPLKTAGEIASSKADEVGFKISLTPKEQNDIANELNLKSEAIKEGVGKGINIPTEKVIDLAQKPYWSKLKEFFKKPEEPGVEELKNNQGFIKKGISKATQAIADTFDYVKTGWNNLVNAYYPVYKKFGGKATEQPLLAMFLKNKARLLFDQAKSEIYDKTFEELAQKFDKYSPDDLDNLMVTRGKGSSPQAEALQAEAFKELPIELQDPNIQKAHTESTDWVFKWLTDNGITDLNYVEDYIRGSYKWKNKGEADKFLEFWKSSDSFTKKKSFPTYADAKAFDPTVRLKEPNPIRNARSELMTGANRVGMMRLKESLLTASKAPADNNKSYAVMKDDATLDQQIKWNKIKDPLFADMLFEPSYAKFVNNLIEVNKLEQPGLLKGLRNTAKAAQVTKFALSAFHLKNITKAVLADEAMGMVDPKAYKLLAKAFSGVDRTDPAFVEYTGMTGGHHSAVEVEAQQALTNFIDKLSKGKLEGLGTKLGKVYAQTKWIPASPEMIRWQFEKFIPDVKFLKWQEECAYQTERLGRPLEVFEKQDIARNIQNFYGEMNEQLFGRSGTVTAGLRIIFSAPGYGEGNFRALFKSAAELRDTAKAGAGKLTGKDLGEMPKYGYKNTQFIMTSFINTLILATIGTRIMTGKWPGMPKNGEDVRDNFKIKTNFKDGNGDDIYYDMMDYANDFYSVYGNIATGQFHKIPKTLGTRVTGAESIVFKALTDVADLSAGKVIYDFKGTPVYQKNDPFEDKFNKLLAHWGTGAQPISLSSFKGSKEGGIPTGLAIAGSVAGFRTTSAEKIKTLKEIRQDVYSLGDAKRNEAPDINKIYNQNQEEGEKKIDAFNNKQMRNLKVIITRLVAEGISEDEITKDIGGNLKQIKNRYFITSTKGKKNPETMEENILDLFKKQPRSKRNQSPEENKKVSEMLKSLGMHNEE